MPVLIPIIPILIGAAVGGAVAVGIGIAVSIGLSFAMMRTPDGQNNNTVSNSYKTNPTELTFASNAPRRLVYGFARVSGVVSYANVEGDGYENLYMAIVVASHQITSISEIYFDNVPSVEMDSSYFEWWFHDGSQTTADSRLVSLFPEYNSNCILTGCAYAVVKLKYNKEIWKNGRPNITFDIKGKAIYDPRDGITRWTNNAALVLADFMTSPDGLGATYQEMDWESVKTAANISDEKPALMTANLCDGRYTIDGVVELSSRNGDIINNMTSACAGTVVWTEGKYTIFAGADREEIERPITSNDLRDNPTLTPRVSSDQIFNCVKGTFLDSTSGWVYTDFPVVKGEDFITEDGVEIFKDLVLPFTTSPITAQRLATLYLRKARLETVVNLPCKWTCFNYEVHDVVKLHLPELGWDNKLFQVTDWKMTPPSGNDAGGVDLVLAEYAHELWSDDMSLKPINTGGVIIPPDVTIPKPVKVIYIQSDSSTLDNQNSPRFRLDWVKPLDIYAVNYEIAYGKYPYTPSESDYVLVQPITTIHWFSGPLELGETYQAYVRVRNSFNKVSNPIITNPVKAQGSILVIPQSVDGFSAVTMDAFADLYWLSPLDNSTKVVIKWGKTSDPTKAALLAEVPSTQTNFRILNALEGGFYFVAFKSATNTVGAFTSSYLQGRPMTENVKQVLKIDKSLLDVDGGVWVNRTTLVSKSQSLASELGWDVFDKMVPNPVSQIEAFNKNEVFVEGSTYRVGGVVNVSYAQGEGAPATATTLKCQLAHANSIETVEGIGNLTGNANAKLGFLYSVASPHGAVITYSTGSFEVFP